VIPKEKEQWIENIGQNVLVFAAIISPRGALKMM
jgi:hypothetical protein